MVSKKDDKEMADRPEEAHPAQGEQPAAERPRRAPAEAAESGARMAEPGFAQAGETGRRLIGASARAYRGMADISRGDVDVFMQTGARLAKGFQDVSWEMMQFTQNSLRMGLQAANDMMSCRSLEDVIEVQRNFLKNSVDSLLQESARLFEISTHVAGEATSPMAERFQSRGEAGRRPS
ncbi:MAG: phasin family protein [Magnetospirillum sp.]|nr:phasin family protein [Magnetospirillum sp.]